MPARRRVRLRALLFAGVSMTLTAGCKQITNPNADVELQQSLYDLQDLLVQMREETSLLQLQVDSLQGVVARQDSSLRKIANLMGSPIP